MNLTDVLALIGAITGTIGTMLALGALGWDFYKWRYSERVRLRVTAAPNFVSTDNPNQPMIFVSIANIGRITTTIKIISLQGFESKKALKKRHGQKISVVRSFLYNQLPVKLSSGEDWGGGIRQDTPDIDEFMKFKHFIVSIEDSVSDWPFRAEVDKALMRSKF